jgi:hypothetical protein
MFFGVKIDHYHTDKTLLLAENTLDWSRLELWERIRTTLKFPTLVGIEWIEVLAGHPKEDLYKFL